MGQRDQNYKRQKEKRDKEEKRQRLAMPRGETDEQRERLTKIQTNK